MNTILEVSSLLQQGFNGLSQNILAKQKQRFTKFPPDFLKNSTIVFYALGLFFNVEKKEILIFVIL